MPSSQTVIKLSPSVSAVVRRRVPDRTSSPPKQAPSFAPQWEREIVLLSEGSQGTVYDVEFTALILAQSYAKHSDRIKCIWDVKRVAREVVSDLLKARVSADMKAVKKTQKKLDLAEARKSIALADAREAALVAAAKQKAEDASWIPASRRR